ncbi:hypothetical protein [Bradyrhizobium sp. DOA1]|uniref:hypothetical protein n=1 Tax=Bradyrhizobium sp. DOA1 TaxID=1126616 RepID=UPI00077C280F|nr:hypothetical protein [Bradyrhizobium sp. DOA1]KYG97567.1 hypothetical protein SE91_02455 [Bradyrhizobium sp. DOA1]
MYQSDDADVAPLLAQNGGNLSKSLQYVELMAPTTSTDASMIAFEIDCLAIWLAQGLICKLKAVDPSLISC